MISPSAKENKMWQYPTYGVQQERERVNTQLSAKYWWFLCSWEDTTVSACQLTHYIYGWAVKRRWKMDLTNVQSEKSQMLCYTRKQVYSSGPSCADASWCNHYAIVQALGLARVHCILLIYLTRPQRKLLVIWKFLHTREVESSLPEILAFVI